MTNEKTAFPTTPTWPTDKSNESSTSTFRHFVISSVRVYPHFKLACRERYAGMFRFSGISRGWKVRMECKLGFREARMTRGFGEDGTSSVFDIFDATVYRNVRWSRLTVADGAVRRGRGHVREKRSSQIANRASGPSHDSNIATDAISFSLRNGKGHYFYTALRMFLK